MKLKLQALAAVLLLAVGGIYVTTATNTDDVEKVRMVVNFPHTTETARYPVLIRYVVNEKNTKVANQWYPWKKEFTVPKGSTVSLYARQNIPRTLECLLQVGNRPLVRDWRNSMGGVLCWSQGSIGPGGSQ